MLKSRLSDLYLPLYFTSGTATEWLKKMGISQLEISDIS
jgi:hypothetical protein